MTRARLISVLPCLAAYLVGCSSSFTHPDSGMISFTNDSGPSDDMDSGMDGGCLVNCGPADSGEPEDGGPADAGPKLPKVTTVKALVDGEETNPRLELVELDSVVVVAVHTVSASTDPTVFYVQDKTPAGPGIRITHLPTDTSLVPTVGEVVTITGQAAVRNGVLSVATSKPAGITLTVVVDMASGGVSSGGAYAPAGTPITNATTVPFAATADAGTELLGNVLDFSETLAITMKNAITTTNADGGTIPLGFEVTGGMYVYDDYLRVAGCLHPDGGLTFPHGITGVWDRYQTDAQVDAGTATPVLYLMNCTDLNP